MPDYIYEGYIYRFFYSIFDVDITHRRMKG